MKRLLAPEGLLFVLGVALVVAFTNWYRGPLDPLSEEEQDYFLQRLSQQTGAVAEFLNPDEASRFMQEDDGRGFYVMNLFKFNEQAQYGGTDSVPVSGEEAFNLFTSKVIPIWLANGAHPIFSSALDRQGYGEWDFASVVRYRSRRDFFTIQISDEFLAAVPDRIAAARSNLRLKVSGNQIPLPITLVLICTTLAWALILVMVRAFRCRHAQSA